jgi:hypothetical protein
VAEESGKGIALVILGIVAIIAIVGLVLLFTGARKSAVGEFAVPAAKEYGGAIRGVLDPESRAFSGRSYEFPSGADGATGERFSGFGGKGYYQPIADTQYGESVKARAVSSQTNLVHNEQLEEIPAYRACTWLSLLNGVDLPVSLDYNEHLAWQSLGRQTASMQQLTAGDWVTKTDQYGLDRDAVINDINTAIQDGSWGCGERPGFA